MDNLVLQTKYPNLKKQFKGGKNSNFQVWSKENILDGFNKFLDENNRYPTALEIDAYEFLPSSRQIQRSFGGLVKLRQELGFKIVNYGAGDSRSIIGKTINVRGRSAEREMETILINHFGEHFVHIEKPLYKYYSDKTNTAYDNKFRADFFVYAAGDYQFCVDVFYTRNIHNFRGVIHSKIPNYTGLEVDVYLVNMNHNEKELISQNRIQVLLNNKINKIDDNIRVMTKDNFIKMIANLKRLSIKPN